MSSNITPPTTTTFSLGVTHSLHSVTSPAPDTLVKICLLWTMLHRTVSLPPACKGVISEDKISELRAKGDFGNVLSNINYDVEASQEVYESKTKLNNHRESIRYHYQYSSRSLSVIGVLGGIVLILMFVALSTCVKNRRNIATDQEGSGHESFARQILIDHIRHLSTSRRTNNNGSGREPPNDTPPSYEDVVKPSSSTSDMSSNGDSTELEDDECQPPSYIEAIAASQAVEISSYPAGIHPDHVVQIELTSDRGDGCDLLPEAKFTGAQDQVWHEMSRIGIRVYLLGL
eukprot:maker-scaffold142_size315517-snap-gene-1.15 protein:Tk07701 transcript:maker-scaffold142_size315517-snap-gene-1.15-mRNA-1 annotation:"leucine-rich repeat-containing protein 37a2-like"